MSLILPTTKEYLWQQDSPVRNLINCTRQFIEQLVQLASILLPHPAVSYFTTKLELCDPEGLLQPDNSVNISFHSLWFILKRQALSFILTITQLLLPSKSSI